MVFENVWQNKKEGLVVHSLAVKRIYNCENIYVCGKIKSKKVEIKPV